MQETLRDVQRVPVRTDIMRSIVIRVGIHENSLDYRKRDLEMSSAFLVKLVIVVEIVGRASHSWLGDTRVHLRRETNHLCCFTQIGQRIK